MASANAEQHHNHLHTESLPLIDLRLLSQAELFSLSLCSSSPSPPSQDGNDVSTPKIDRSVFNESAGSRKQTFSRLRLAPRNQQYHSQFGNSTADTSVSRQQLQQPFCDEENSRIVALLKRLFDAEDSLPANNVNDNGSNNLVTVPVVFKEDLTLPMKTSVDSNLQSIQTGITDSSGHNYGCTGTVGPVSGGTSKRKRGRPRKPDNVVTMNTSQLKKNECLHVPIHNQSIGINESKAMMIHSNAEYKEMVLVNRNGTMVDLAALSRAEDPYGEELRRRSLGIVTEEGLLAFLSSLSGEWGSRRKKRKIVDASDLGDFLPKGWKLILCIKKKAGRFWLACRRYISPNGLQFVSCKEVSSYLLSYFLQDSSLLNCGHVDDSIRLVDNTSFQNASHEDDRKWSDAVHPSRLSFTSAEQENGAAISEIRSSREVEMRRKFKCHKCTMSFDEPGNLLQHLCSCHQRALKRLKLDPSFTEEVIIKDGRYECQFCCKLFEERHCFSGHLGKHIKDYLKKFEASANVQNSTGTAFVGGTVNDLKMKESIGNDKDSFPLTPSVKTWDETRSCGNSHTFVENDTVESSYGCGGLLFHDKQSLKPNRKGKILGEECHEKENKVGIIANDKGEEMNESTDLVSEKPYISVGAESTLLNIEINGTYVLKFNTYEIDNCDVKGITAHSCSITASGSDGTCIIDNDVNVVPTGSLEEEKLETGCHFEIKDKAISNQNTEDGGSGGKDELISDFGSKPHGRENAAIDIEKPHSEYYSVVKGCGSLNNLNGYVTSNVVQERDFEGGLTSPVINERTSAIGAYLNNNFSTTSDESNFNAGLESGNIEAPTSSGKNLTTSDVNAVPSNDHKRIYGCHSATLSRNEMQLDIEYYLNGTSNCMTKKPVEVRHIENGSWKLSGSEHQSHFLDNNSKKFSSGKIMVPRLDVLGESLNIGLGNNAGSDAATITCFEAERTSVGDKVPSTAKQTFTSKNCMACCSMPKDLKVVRNLGLDRSFIDEQTCANGNKASKITSDESRHKEINTSRRTDLCNFFGNNCDRRNAITNTLQKNFSDSFSMVVSGDERTIPSNTNEIGACSSCVDELKQEKGSLTGILSLPAFHFVDGDKNNLSGAFSSTVQKEPGLKHLKYIMKNDSPYNNSVDEVMGGRNEETCLIGDLSDASSQQVESAVNFPTHAMSKKA